MKVTRNIDTGDEKQTIRTISTKPKEHFEGRWKSGRLYPLYSVVVNNGTTFISQNAKMKEEPYVIYDAVKKEFKAPDGWLIKEMSADSRVTALGGGGEGGVTPEEVEEMIKDKVDKVDGKGLSTNDYDNTEKNKVASAYKKPNNGIPKSDLAKAVQDVLDDADGAYKKPVTGIPFADLADGVQDSLSNADEAKAGLAGKQDTISDLQTIRTGAAAGATAYQKPSGGVPKSDLASTVQTSIGKADTAIQPAEFNELEEEVGTIRNGAYEEAWDGSSAPIVADIPAGVSVTHNGTSYTGTLAASASTVDKIYLVSDGNGNYDRYTTVEANGAYSWKKVGSTAIPLSNYATKTQVNQLEAKVTEIEGRESAVTGWVSGQYIVNNQSVGSTCPKQVVTGQSAWRSVIVAVPPYADKYIINGEGGSTPRLWSFLDSNDVVLALSVQSAIGTNDALKVNVPTGATQLIINSKTSENCYEFVEGLIPPIQADVAALRNDVDGLSEEVKEQGTDIDTIPYVCERVDKFALNATTVTKSVSLSANTRYLVKLHYFGLSATDFQRMNKLVFLKTNTDVLSINFSDIQNDEVYITPSDDVNTVKVALLSNFVVSADKKMSIDIITCNNEDVPITKWDKAIKDNIEDSLESSSPQKTLAARQGKILAERITEQDYGLDFSRDYNIVNTIGMSWTPNGEIKTDGTIVSNNNKSVSDYIAIDATKGYLYLGISVVVQYYDETNQQNVIATAAPLDKSRYCFYDKDKTVISTVVNSDFSKEIPINAAFVRITASTIYRDFARLIYGNYNETISSRQVDYRLTLQDTFKFSPTGYERLKMVAFGDSLTHGRFDGVTGKPRESWPDYANDELRSNIINCGFGGTRMTGNSLFCFYKLCETIVSEDADKWDDYDAYVVDNPEFAYNLNILKNIDWATVDAISVWYGANDYPSNIPIGQSYNEDESTFDGACIKGIKMLLQKYPHLQVLVLSPIWGIRGGKNVDYETNTEGLTMPDYVNAIKRVSERLHIPVVDMYHTFQFNDINKLVYSSDATHIRSNAGFKRLAHTIVEQIKLYIVPKDL